MQTKSIAVEGLRDLLNEGNQKQNFLHSFDGKSYLQQTLVNLAQHNQSLIEFFIWITENKLINGPIFDSVLANLPKRMTSILGFCFESKQIFTSESRFSISHQQSFSEGVFLSLFLAKHLSTTVHLICAQKSLKDIGYVIAGKSEVDKLGFTKEAVSKEGIVLHLFENWSDQTWINPQQIVVIDVFGLNPIQYRPFLLKYYQQLTKTKKVVLYHSHLQSGQIQIQLSLVETQAINWLILQVWPEYPLQVIGEKDENQMFLRFFDFLQSESLRSERQDVVIFIEADKPVRKYINKFNEHLSKSNVKQIVNLVYKPRQILNNYKNNIFLVSNINQLKSWDYDYRKVAYVLDYHRETAFRFDYEIGAYVHEFGHCNGIQKAKRMAIVNSNQVGRYSYLQSSTINRNKSYIDAIDELSTYILKMIVFGVGNYLQIKQKRMENCLKLMQSVGIIKLSQKNIQISDQRIVNLVEKGINPIEAKLILNIRDDASLDMQQKERFSNLMLMFLSVVRNELSLHKYRVGAQMMSSRQWDSLWKTSGYLQSCLTILTKCDIIQCRKLKIESNSEAQIFKKISSQLSEKMSDDMFGSLFQTCYIDAQKSDFDYEIPEVLKKQLVQQQAFYQVRQRLDHSRQILEIKPVQIIIQKQDIEYVIRTLIDKMPNTVASYSGFKRIGYKFEKCNIVAKFNQQNLYAKSRKHPQYLYVSGLIKNNENYQILYANSVTSQQLLSIVGHVPLKNSKSHGQGGVQFHGISSSTFQSLRSHENEQKIQKFQSEYNCEIQLTPQFSLITIHCSKGNTETIKTSFECLLEKVKQQIYLHRRVVHYLGKVNLVIGGGGIVEQIMRENPVTFCWIEHLHVDVTTQDLEQLFEQFFVLKKIEMIEVKENQIQKSAFLQFYSPRDYLMCYEYFNGCLYFGMNISIRPAKDQFRGNKLENKQYVEFRWFVWQSHGKALISFKSKKGASEVEKYLTNLAKFDDSDIIVSQELGSDFKICISNLNERTDEGYLIQNINMAQILQLEIMRSPIRQETKPEFYLDRLISKVAQSNNFQNPVFSLQEIQRKFNGQRVCRVNFSDNNFMSAVVQEYDHMLKILGQGRLYAVPYYQKPVFVPTGLASLYLQIFEQMVSKNQATGVKTRYAKEGENEYIVLISNNSGVGEAVYRLFLKNIAPQKKKLAKNERYYLFNNIALSNLVYIEELYHCKMSVDLIQKDIYFIATQQVHKKIQDEIEKKLCKQFFYMVRLNPNAHKHFKQNEKEVLQLQHKFYLSLMEIERDSYSVLLKGSVENVERAVTYLMHFAESLVKPEEQRINPDACGICCNSFKQPYRMQRCSHIFCSDCLKEYFKSVFADVSLFPVKCPHCLQLMTLRDLQANLSKAEWEKLKLFAMNNYMGLQGGKLCFCYSAGCKQINFIDGPIWNCDVCKISYCNGCKETYHPGIRCEDVATVRQTDEYFKKYLLENGGRQCPNPGCKMPVVKIDGCNKVLCTRCNKSMCFKCPPDKMIAYETPTQAYDHLNAVHGGYY